MPQVFAIVLLSIAAARPAAAALEDRLRAAISASSAEVAVAVRLLDGRSEILIDADKSFMPRAR